MLGGLLETIIEFVTDCFDSVDTSSAVDTVSTHMANGQVTFSSMGDGRFDTSIISAAGNAVGGNADGSLFDKVTHQFVDKWGNPL